MFSEHLFCKWGQNIFPLSVFLQGELFLNRSLEKEPTHVCVYIDPPPFRLIAVGSGG